MTTTTWTQTAGMDSGSDSDTVLSYAEAAALEAEAAAASAAASSISANASAASASASSASSTQSSGFAGQAEASAVAAAASVANPNIATVAGSISNVNAVGASIGPVNTVAGGLADVTTVAAGLANVGTVAGISADVTSVAGISGSVTTVAGMGANITSVLADATDIGTVAGSIAGVNSVAGNLPAITAVNALSADISAVVADAADIGTVAGIAASVTAVAGARDDILEITSGNNLLNVGSVAGMSAQIPIVAGDSSEINTLAAITSSVQTVAGISADVTSVAGASGDILTVVGSLSSVNTVAAEIDALVSIEGSVASASASAATAAEDAATADSAATQAAIDAAQVAADRIVVAGNAASTSADVVTTAANATATAADRVQTGLDVIATAADVVSIAGSEAATAADRVQTGLDAAATAADLVQTSADVAEAQAAATQALGYRDTASLHKLAAEAAATSATNTAAALTGLDLSAIAATKAVTAVDVFVYDTSKDSDGGAWRKRTQGTSWYQEALNTATRGSRREFPAVAVIVAEAAKVTIYDGDDPSLPMWMVFTGGVGASWVTSSYAVLYSVASSVSATDGKMLIGFGNASLGGASLIDFISETAKLYSAYGGSGRLVATSIKDRNLTSNPSPVVSGYAIVKNTVNDVAMTVLPNAPIDAATGLPVPTIAVATEGGVSVIKDDGTVVDITASHSSYTSSSDVTFSETGALTLTLGHPTSSFSYNQFYVFYTIPSADNILTLNTKVGTTANADEQYSFYLSAPTDLKLSRNATTYTSATGVTNLSDRLAISLTGNSGLSVIKYDKVTPSNGMSSNITSKYNTGWMNGDIKGAFLSDTDDTDLVGGVELVTNGTFDTDVSGWTAGSLTSGGSTLSVDTNQLKVLNTGVNGTAYQSFSTVSGSVYTFSVDVNFITNTSYALRVGTTLNGSHYLNGSKNTGAGTTGTITTTFVATGSVCYVTVGNLGTTGDYSLWDNISVQLADADRSVNNKPLNINGTVTRSPVATGADLVAYSGFSASNYLEQPYNSDLDFGTGDFCVMGWVNGTISGDAILHRYSGASAGQLYIYGSNGTAKLSVILGTSGAVDSGIGLLSGNNQFVVLRRSGVVEIYINGDFANSAAMSDDLSLATTPTLLIGTNTTGLNPLTSAKLSLLRISATAPTAAQIAKIYNDEKVLFQENAQATLYGTSDAVTALAHDDATGLLHVGTSGGRSVFQGLRRVSNTTTAVGTAISASNGLVVEE